MVCKSLGNYPAGRFQKATNRKGIAAMELSLCTILLWHSRIQIFTIPFEFWIYNCWTWNVMRLSMTLLQFFHLLFYTQLPEIDYLIQITILLIFKYRQRPIGNDPFSELTAAINLKRFWTWENPFYGCLCRVYLGKLRDKYMRLLWCKPPEIHTKNPYGDCALHHCLPESESRFASWRFLTVWNNKRSGK